MRQQISPHQRANHAQPALTIPHVLDDPPPFHGKLLDYGERLY
ncbi:MAG: hypothetical protein R2867_32420 [Caldilineaceae bacterium]